MSKNTDVIPFTEIVERVQRLSRSGDNTAQKIRGVVQDVYVRDIPSKYDWNFLYARSSFQTIDQYNTGNVTLNTGDTAVIGNSSVSFSAAMVGRKIRFDSNDVIYDVTGFNNTTSLTIAPSLQGPANISAGGYTVFQDVYALAGDFDRFPKDGGIFKWSGGRKEPLREESFQEQLRFSQGSPMQIAEKVRLLGTDTAGNQLVQMRPAPSVARNYGYEYIRRLRPLIETTAGTLLSTSASTTTVIGNTDTRFLEATSDGTYWFRVDVLGAHQDSSWYPVLAIANNSSMTLGVSFANTAITSSANYTISRAPEMPPRLHAAVLFGALEILTRDQNDEYTAVYRNQYAQVLSDSKRIYVSRQYSQEITGAMEDWRYRR